MGLASPTEFLLDQVADLERRVGCRPSALEVAPVLWDALQEQFRNVARFPCQTHTVTKWCGLPLSINPALPPSKPYRLIYQERP